MNYVSDSTRRIKGLKMTDKLDLDIERLQTEIYQLLADISRKRQLWSSRLSHPFGDDKAAGDNSIKSSSERSTPAAPIPNGIPFGLTLDDFRYLEYDKNGKLVQFWTKPVKLKGKRL